MAEQYNRVFDKVIDPMYRWECDESGLGHGGYIEFRNAQLTQLATEFLKAIEVTPPYEHCNSAFTQVCSNEALVF